MGRLGAGDGVPVAHKDSHDPDGSDPLDAAAPDTNITPEQTNAEGDASTWARSDHMHYIPSGTPSTVGSANSEGNGAAFARTNHIHAREHAKYTDANARSAAVSDTVYGAGWNNVTTIAPSKNAVYDKIEALSGGAATKEFFASVTIGVVGATMGLYGRFPVAICDAATNLGAMSWIMPSDFSSITELVCIVIPRATQASADWGIFSEYAANGQSYDTHAEGDAATTYNVTSGQMFEVDLSGIFSSLAAGDYCGVYLRQAVNGHNFNIIGVRVKYS